MSYGAPHRGGPPPPHPEPDRRVMAAAAILPMVLALGVGVALRLEGMLPSTMEWMICPLGGLGSVIAVVAYAFFATQRAAARAGSARCPHCAAPLPDLATGRCPRCKGALVPDRMLHAGGREAELRRRFEAERLAQLAPRRQALTQFRLARSRQLRELFVFGYFAFIPGILGLALSLGLLGKLLSGRIAEVPWGVYVGLAICGLIFGLCLRRILRPFLERRALKRGARPGLDRVKEALEARGEALTLASSEARRAWLDAHWPGPVPLPSLEMRPSARVLALERAEVPIWLELDLCPHAPYGRVLAAIWDHQGAQPLEGAQVVWADYGLRVGLGRPILDAVRQGDPAPLLALLERLEALLREGEGLPAARLG